MESAGSYPVSYVVVLMFCFAFKEVWSEGKEKEREGAWSHGKERKIVGSESKEWEGKRKGKEGKETKGKRKEIHRKRKDKVGVMTKESMAKQL